MDERDVIELLAKILIEGRGGGVISPNDPQFGIGGSALPRKSRSRITSSRTRTGSSRRARGLLPKPKRKVSAYQKEFGRQLKMLKKKHPKTPVSRLMKRAHVATRKARK